MKNKETLTYTEASKKEERIFNSNMLKEQFKKNNYESKRKGKRVN